MAKKKSTKRKAAKSSAGSTKKGTKNSLVGNINRRKKAGTSRKKEDSTVSPEAYSQMKKGWPKKKSGKRKKS